MAIVPFCNSCTAVRSPRRLPVAGSMPKLSRTPSRTRNFSSEFVSGASSAVACSSLSGSASFAIVQNDCHVLPQERSCCVRQVVLIAQGAYAFADLGVSVARQVGEQVVLDLVAQVAAHERHQRAGVKVGRSQHLSQVPLRLGFVLELLPSELLGAIGEVSAEDHHVRPVVADQVGDRVGRQGVLPVAARQGRKDDVVLADLLAHLLTDYHAGLCAPRPSTSRPCGPSSSPTRVPRHPTRTGCRGACCRQGYRSSTVPTAGRG